ncbi:sigma-70 family RNA polymerase sigma factor [bacterium CPR1]|nr:sigma-70 family RNA polymerase sigma factor [bacterium CPR1]
MLTAPIPLVKRRAEVTERALTSDQEDVLWMQQVKAGNAEAFSNIIRKYQKTVLNLTYRFTGDPVEAEDLAQEVFLRVYRAADRFEARAKFFTYVYQVTLNLCRNERAKVRHKRNTSLDAPMKEGEPDSLRQIQDPSGSAEELLTRQELGDVVREAVLSLPEEQREAVMMQRFQDLSYEEIAEILKLSVPAVKSRLHRAKLALKEKLSPYLKG